MEPTELTLLQRLHDSPEIIAKCVCAYAGENTILHDVGRILFFTMWEEYFLERK
jgi:hypothetical protein